MPSEAKRALERRHQQTVNCVQVMFTRYDRFTSTLAIGFVQTPVIPRRLGEWFKSTRSGSSDAPPELAPSDVKRTLRPAPRACGTLSAAS